MKLVDETFSLQTLQAHKSVLSFKQHKLGPGKLQGPIGGGGSGGGGVYSKQNKIISQNWEMCPFDDTFVKGFFLITIKKINNKYPMEFLIISNNTNIIGKIFSFCSEQ